MELMLAWFWLIKLFLTASFIYLIYLAAVVKKFKSKVLNVLTIVVGILLIVSPIKMKPTTDLINTMQTQQIQAAKVLPLLIKDDSFAKSTKIDGITAEDLK